jgi:hypothetical protein
MLAVSDFLSLPVNNMPIVSGILVPRNTIHHFLGPPLAAVSAWFRVSPHPYEDVEERLMVVLVCVALNL